MSHRTRYRTLHIKNRLHIRWLRLKKKVKRTSRNLRVKCRKKQLITKKPEKSLLHTLNSNSLHTNSRSKLKLINNNSSMKKRQRQLTNRSRKSLSIKSTKFHNRASKLLIMNKRSLPNNLNRQEG